MTLNIELSPDLEFRLKSEAARRGEPTDRVAVHLLDEHLPRAKQRDEAVDILKQWAEEATTMSDEEMASNAAVLRTIDDDRLSDRRLFDAVLSGP
jgi:hypothetical protein